MLASRSGNVDSGFPMPTSTTFFPDSVAKIAAEIADSTPQQSMQQSSNLSWFALFSCSAVFR